MKRILIADDHSLIRAGLKQILAERSNTDVIEASSGSEVLSMLKKYDVHAVVVDISMPGKNGLEVVKEIHDFYNHIPILVLSVYPEEQYGLRSLKAGASGYLTKDSAPEKLIEAIDKVLAGGKYLSPFIAEQMISELSGKSNASGQPHHELSDREYEVLKLIGAGKTPTQIGDELFLSVKTISTYRTRILGKMKMKSTSELIHYVAQQGLLK